MYPYNGGPSGTSLLADFSDPMQWVIEPKTKKNGSFIPYNAAIIGGLPDGATYNCAVKNLQIRVASGAQIPFGGIRMHGCPGSVIESVSIVGTGIGVLVNQCYGGKYQAHTISHYYGSIFWQDINACDINMYSTVTDRSVKFVPNAYVPDFISSLSSILVSTHRLSTNSHYNRCWGMILGADGTSTSIGNVVNGTIEDFSGGYFQLFSMGADFGRMYVEGAAAAVDYAFVAANSRFSASSTHAFNTDSGNILDIGVSTYASLNVTGIMSGASWG